MAAMPVIGIDLGNESCYVAVAKAGGIETIANDYSLRATPSCIAFSDKNRILGVAAKNQQVTNMKNTVYGLKRLLGRKFRDPHVQRELQFLPFNVKEVAQGNIGIQVNYLNEQHTFSPEQCLAMLLTKLKDISTTALQSPVNDCVISVPSYFTNNERKALLDSASIAGLNVLRLFNETTATALSYGIYKQDLPGPEEKPRNVVFVDCGHSSLQVFICAFNKDRLRMINVASDPNLGGRDVDLVLADYFCKEFQSKYKLDVKSNPRAFLRLVTEVEKVKKQMSANSTTLPLNIECFMNDKDVHGEIKRTDMEQLCGHLFHRVEVTLKQCLDKSGLGLDEIYAVEIVGGSSRIPAIKQLIEKTFRKTPSTSLNQDEAVSRGCALQCAMLSPAVRVREFNVKDVQNYPVSVSWDASTDGGESAGEIEVFPVNHVIPYSKMLTFYPREPFSIQAFYSGPVPYPDRHIGTWNVKDIRPSPDGRAQKVKVKVRINLHGIMTVSGASLIEAKESSSMDLDNGAAEENQQQQQNELKENCVDGHPASPEDAPMENNTSGSGGGGGATPASPEDGGDKDKKDKAAAANKKQTVKCIELPIEALTYGFSQVEINQYTEQEFKMIAADRQEKERADARNALEEYVYELRSKLSADDGELAPYVLETDRQQLVQLLDHMENWLYEEGEDCNRQVYCDKLAELKQKGEPIQTRKIETELRPHVIEDFAKSLQLCMKALEQIKENDPKYAHLTDEDVKKVDSAFKQAWQWLEQTRNQLHHAPKHLPPPITIAQMRQEKANFESTVTPILNKPVPKAASPPKDNNAQQQETKKNAGENNEHKHQQQQQQQKEGSANTNTSQDNNSSKNSTSQQQQENNMEWQSN